jgi:glucan biosynthesis protein C
MKVLQRKSERIHSLDSLRALMMLLGIVIHSAIPYMVTEFGFNKDPNATHLSIDTIFALIHSFRMHVFMVVAGFFGAMLFYERGPLKMLKNRASRVLFPFIVFLLLLYPTLMFSWIYADATFAGSNHAMAEAAANFYGFLPFLPDATWHL